MMTIHCGFGACEQDSIIRRCGGIDTVQSGCVRGAARSGVLLESSLLIECRSGGEGTRCDRAMSRLGQGVSALRYLRYSDLPCILLYDASVVHVLTGAGLGAQSAQVLVDRSVFYGSQSVGAGGAVRTIQSDMDIFRSSFMLNRVVGSAGAASTRYFGGALAIDGTPGESTTIARYVCAYDDEYDCGLMRVLCVCRCNSQLALHCERRSGYGHGVLHGGYLEPGGRHYVARSRLQRGGCGVHAQCGGRWRVSVHP